MQGLADGIPSGCYGLVSMFGQRTSQMEGLSGFQTRVEWMTVGSRFEVKNRQNKGIVRCSGSGQCRFRFRNVNGEGSADLE